MSRQQSGPAWARPSARPFGGGGRRRGVDGVVATCPAVMLGPVAQAARLNASTTTGAMDDGAYSRIISKCPPLPRDDRVA